ncbi:MAG: hypothetical protein R3B09_06355 [Nannocystaceae bacterium]
MHATRSTSSRLLSTPPRRRSTAPGRAPLVRLAGAAARAVARLAVSLTLVQLGGCLCDLLPFDDAPGEVRMQGPIPDPVRRDARGPGPEGAELEEARPEGAPGEGARPPEPADSATAGADPGPRPADVQRDLHPRGPDGSLCLEMYSVCDREGRCTSGSFTLECGEIGTIPGGDRVRCVCP